MNRTLSKVKDLPGRCCLTILFNTHRTLPDNEKDPLVLKNLISEAVRRLPQECNNDDAALITEKLNAIAPTIDHRQNFESLALFVSADVAEYTRLPVSVTDRVTIGTTFATRDLIRALYKEKGYYILVLGRDEARLIEAFNDKVVQEVEEGFPMTNVLNPSQRAEAAVGSRSTNLQQEFFNLADKQLIEVLKENPLPVILCTDEPNYHHYLKIADRPGSIMGYVSGNRLAEKAHHIVSDIWPVVQQIKSEQTRKRLDELSAAENAGRVAIDVNDIWRAVNHGRGETLFVQNDYHLPARVANDMVELVPEDQADRTGIVDDIIDDIIAINLRQGGDYVFVSGDGLEKYGGMVLTLRY